ncbi:MAG: cardiolipin synthase B [Gemmatimonadales bacterium]|nr:cardiolipin synthase B [Gemmatimonadales bacterium]
MSGPGELAVGSDVFERAIERAAGAPGIPGNRVAMLVDGPETYDVMLEQIAAAEQRIHLEQYILAGDATGERFVAALEAKAREGVKVRVLYDWVGCILTPRRIWRRLRAAGAEVIAFGIPRFRDPLLIVARDHRKVLVVDGKRGVTGGLCIGDEWMGDPARQRLPWRDTAIAIDGPGARALDQSFRRAWVFAGGAPPDDAGEVGADVPACGETTVRIVATEPGRERAFRTIDLMLAAAQEKVWVTEAYLVAPQRLYEAFKDAARAGTDVRMVLPGHSDLRVVRNLSRIGYRGLMSAGVRLWEWDGPMLHAKTIVVDGRWVRIGSSNLNPSSLLANWEVDVLVEDVELAMAMERQFLGDIAGSREVIRKPRIIPEIFGRTVPPSLAREHPNAPGTSPHVPGGRERRRRAITALSGLVRGARAALFGPLAAVLLLAAVSFTVFPYFMAWVAAVLCAGLGTMALVRALGHRDRG